MNETGHARADLLGTTRAGRYDATAITPESDLPLRNSINWHSQ